MKRARADRLVFIATGWIALLCAVCSLPAMAEIYKWVDENGRVHYGDKKPATGNTQTLEGDVNTVDSQRYDFLPPPPSSREEAAQGSVVMYSTSWCGYCRKARKYFRNQGIPFVEHDIEKSRSAKREFERLGGKGVPLILVGDRQMSGFSRQRFEALYRR